MIGPLAYLVASPVCTRDNVKVILYTLKLELDRVLLYVEHIHGIDS